MTKQKSTKRALLMSGLALLMCVSMLIGSTFAWFTDSVTSTNNKIVAGTLDVQLLMADSNGSYSDISNSTSPIFGKGSIAQNNNAETLWEPGKTQVAYLAIKNNGNLDLKYTVGLDVENVSKDLYKVMEYAITPDAQYGSVTDWAGNGNNVVVGTQSVSGDVALKVGETHYFALAIHMNEDAGNEYQGGEVNFDLTVLATQLASEYDSFDNQYDANATYGTYIELNAGDDLMAAMASAEADMPLTIKLNGDVEWPTTGTHGEKNITPASSIVIDGNGYTLTATGSGVTPLGDDNAPMTLKNIKIVDKSVSYAESSWEFTYLEIGGSILTCSNVTFADEIMLGTNATFTNCSFESNEESIYAVWVDDGSAAFNNCIFTGYRGLKAHEDYGSEISSVVVKDCTFSNITKKPGIALGTLNADTTVSITDSNFINCQPGDQNLYIYETDTDVSTIKFTNENNTVATAITDAADLADALAKGENVVLNGDVATEAATTAPYGNKVGFIQNGGVLDGNGNTLSVECSGDDYGIMTSGGTIKNLTIDSGCRAIMIMTPTGDIVVDNVNIGGDGVLYTINTGEAGADGVNLSVTNSTLAGWTSYGPVVEAASFTNVKFEQGEYKDYASIYGRVLKPYVNTTLTDCSFIEHMNLDLSSLTEGHKVTFENCTVNGQAVTADVFTPYSGDDSVYDTALFSVDLPSWTDSIDDCIIFN